VSGALNAKRGSVATASRQLCCTTEKRHSLNLNYIVKTCETIETFKQTAMLRSEYAIKGRETFRFVLLSIKTHKNSNTGTASKRRLASTKQYLYLRQVPNKVNVTKYSG